MSKYIEAGKTGDFTDGSKKKVIVEGREIMLARVGDNYYAVDNRCTHMKGDLSAGTLQGAIITCPRHGSQFDIRDGKNVRWLKGKGLVSAVGKALKSPQGLVTYKVKVEGDVISIEI